ncbi:TIGR02221 family CRISPR-associated protein [Syntrophobacter fumaroxidans]|nr:TIGR02221 family CRISPR-associated protein [Syntrophobacter fumaroxidans]
MEDKNMARVYISFLGTNDYVECRYLDEFDTPEPVRFVQEATIGTICRGWGPGDRITIFTTTDAEKKNWEDNGHYDKDNKRYKECKGLKRCLEELKLTAPFANVHIPDGHSTEEMWDIFQKVFDSLNERDEVVFDITHALRSIPLLAIVVLHYAKVLKRVSLKGIYYGAFEALGSIADVRARPVEERRAPVLDLTDLDKLMDWTMATDRFLQGGDARSAAALAKAEAERELKKTRGKDEAAKAIRSLGCGLEDFSKMLYTCRGREISKASTELKKRAKECRNLKLPKPFRPLFEMIEKRLEAFKGDSLLDGLAAVRWCVDHNLVQQGFTILEEIVFSHTLSGVGLDASDTRLRYVASQAYTIVSRNLDDNPVEWESPARGEEEYTRRMIDFIRGHEDLRSAVATLRARRNDLNHAGFIEKQVSLQKAGDFAEDLERLLGRIEAALTSDF